MGLSLVRAATGDNVDFQGLCITGSTPLYMAPSLTSYSIEESRPCTLPRQQSGAGYGGRDVGGLTKGMNVGELTLPLIHSGGSGQECKEYAAKPPATPSPALAVGGSCSWGPKLRRCSPAPFQLQHSGEQALHLAWAAQQS